MDTFEVNLSVFVGLNVELHKLYSSYNIIWVIKSRRIIVVLQVECKAKCLKILVGKSKRPRRKCEDSIQMDLKIYGIKL